MALIYRENFDSDMARSKFACTQFRATANKYISQMLRFSLFKFRTQANSHIHIHVVDCCCCLVCWLFLSLAQACVYLRMCLCGFFAHPHVKKYCVIYYIVIALHKVSEHLNRATKTHTHTYSPIVCFQWQRKWLVSQEAALQTTLFFPLSLSFLFSLPLILFLRLALL